MASRVMDGMVSQVVGQVICGMVAWVSHMASDIGISGWIGGIVSADDRWCVFFMRSAAWISQVICCIDLSVYRWSCSSGDQGYGV